MVACRVLVETVSRSREMGPARLPPSCALVTMLPGIRFRVQGGSIDCVSEGCSRVAAGGLEWAQPLGREPRSSPVSWHLRFLSVVI